MADEKKRITFEEAKMLYPDEWVVFTEPRIDMENTTFIDGVVYFHGRGRDEALDRSSEVEGDAAIQFTGSPKYRTVTVTTDAANKPDSQAA